MKILLTLILTGCLTLSAAAREKFIAKDGSELFVRRATKDGDFDHPKVIANMSPGTITDRQKRAAANHAGVCVIEDAAGQIISRVYTGRIPLGCEPAILEDGELKSFHSDGRPDTVTTARLQSMMFLYKALIESVGGTFSPYQSCNTPDHKIVTATTDTHAMLNVLSDKDLDPNSHTVLLHEAIVRLTIAEGTKIVGPEATPHFCISTTINPLTDISSATNTIYCGSWGYYAGKEGLRHVYVTPIDSQFNPEPLFKFLEDLKAKSAPDAE